MACKYALIKTTYTGGTYDDDGDPQHTFIPLDNEMHARQTIMSNPYARIVMYQEVKATLDVTLTPLD